MLQWFKRVEPSFKFQRLCRKHIFSCIILNRTCIQQFKYLTNHKMTYVKSWEEFEKAGERLYLQNPLKARYTMKYIHKDGQLYLKLTDDVECLQYKTEIIQDLKKIEKFVGNLMKHMASKEAN